MPQERHGAQLEVAMMLTVAVESVSLRAVHQDAAFLLTLDAICTSAAFESPSKDVRCYSAA